jgi:carbon starvation protein CstA
MNALTVVLVALLVFAIAYRFYALFIAERVLGGLVLVYPLG